MALEDEREQAKALKRKHMSSTKDLQRQIAHCKRSVIITFMTLIVCAYNTCGMIMHVASLCTQAYGAAGITGTGGS